MSDKLMTLKDLNEEFPKWSNLYEYVPKSVSRMKDSLGWLANGAGSVEIMINKKEEKKGYNKCEKYR